MMNPSPGPTGVPGSVHLGGSFPSPHSPIETKPDPATLMNSLNANVASPTGSIYSQSAQLTPRPSSPVSYPPLSGSKHFCAICGDRASGKHYGVYSCEGCKGFFKRTVRKELTYTCRENRDCPVDKKHRNRCQYCRYMKCINSGMRREAVQDERHRANNGRVSREGNRNGESMDMDVSNGPLKMPIERILEAENIAEGAGTSSMEGVGSNDIRMHPGFAGAVENQTTKRKMLHQLIEWAKHIPHFTDLRIEDQVTLIRAGWNELLIAGFAFRSMSLDDGILWADGQVITRENAHLAGVGEIFDRVLVELVGKMKEMKMDQAELGCLRAIVLFNPDAKGLEADSSSQVESYREKVYATLEEYTRTNYESEPSRFAKLLLRLPALRSIGLKCVEHLFFYKLIKDESPDLGSSEQGAITDQSETAMADDPSGSNSSDAARSLDVFIKEVLED